MRHRFTLILLTVLSCAQQPPQPPVATADPGSEPATILEVVGTVRAPSGGFPSVVTLEPAESPTSARAAPSPQAGAAEPIASMDQIAGAFFPPTLVAPVGSTVQFWNSDAIMHNINVADEAGANVFNVGSPPGFEPYRHVFARAGVYRVTCDIHPGMAAIIVAAGTPYSAIAGKDGRFSLAGIAPGRYRATVWNLDPSRRLTRVVDIAPGGGELDLTGGQE